jgi:hypothetical protein
VPRENSPYYLFVWEKQWEQFTNEDGLSLVAASENPDPLGKGRLFLVSVSRPEEKSKVMEHRDYAEPEGLAPGSMKD